MLKINKDQDRPNANKKNEYSNFETQALHAGYRFDETTMATAVPIYLTNAYSYHSVEHASDVFDLRDHGRTYSRLMNPTTDIFEQRVAALEGAVAAVATSSGQAAVLLALLNVAQAGDNIVSSNQLYGGTINLLSHTLNRLGIETRFVDPSNAKNFVDVSDDRTRCWFGEGLPNPKLTPLPISAIGQAANVHGILFVVDNTMTPLISNPISQGAHIVVHSTSKFICGHGTHIGGIVVDGGTFDWVDNAARYPLMTQPDESHGNIEWLKAAEKLGGQYGASSYLLKLRNTLMRDLGPCPSPFASFMFIQGIETLALRMPKHCENAEKVAKFLKSHRAVSSVNYPTLGSSTDKALAQENMGQYGGPMVSFEVEGGLAGGMSFIENLELAYHVSNIGDARTLATHPASTTHATVPKDARIAAGVTDGAIRLSVGIEAIDDIVADLEQALQFASAEA
ncbi:MAG: O-acetylhomoserine aminocarboxypropyltransferase/cysteine synthase family protein [Litoreibacter sp.]